MARFRTIDPKLWQHPFFRKQSWYVRDVFLFLFSAHADDEGRFVADAFAILEGAFSRNHPVTEADVEEALAALDNSKLTLRYGTDSEYGFLVGWYEHQYIEKARRSESSLPPPPVSICSWEAADQAKVNYQEATGRKAQGVYYSDAVRWQEQQTVNSELTESQLDVPLKGREGKGKEGTTKARAKSGAAPKKKLTPQQKAVELLWAAFGFDGKPGGKGYSGIAKLVAEHGVPLVKEYAAAVRRSPPELPEGAERWAWFKKQFRAAMNRPWEWDGSHDNTEKKPGRKLAEYQRKHADELGLL